MRRSKFGMNQNGIVIVFRITAGISQMNDQILLRYNCRLLFDIIGVECKQHLLHTDVQFGSSKP